MGTRRDGASFSKGCSKLSLKESAYFRNISVSAEQMMSIFDKSKAQTSDHYLFFGGHHYAHHDRIVNRIDLKSTRELQFTSEGVVCYELSYGSDYNSPTIFKRLAINKKDPNFRQYSASEDSNHGPRVVFWGSCNMHIDHPLTCATFDLFGPHVSIGWKDSTNYRITDIMFGGRGRLDYAPLSKNNFFVRLKRLKDKKQLTAQAIKDAWYELVLVPNWRDLAVSYNSEDTFMERFSVVVPQPISKRKLIYPQFGLVKADGKKWSAKKITDDICADGSFGTVKVPTDELHVNIWMNAFIDKDTSPATIKLADGTCITHNNRTFDDVQESSYLARLAFVVRLKKAGNGNLKDVGIVSLLDSKVDPINKSAAGSAPIVHCVTGAKTGAHHTFALGHAESNLVALPGAPAAKKMTFSWTGSLLAEKTGLISDIDLAASIGFDFKKGTIL